MRGKTIVITGATSGIGEVAALNLAAQGARIVFIARDKKRADALLGKLPGDAAHAYHLADLSTIANMKRVGAAIADAVPTIDVLMNNAGAIFSKRNLNADGLEMTFAVNHMAYFVLTHALLENVKAAAPGARIVSTSSQMHASGRLDFDDLQMKRGYTRVGCVREFQACQCAVHPGPRQAPRRQRRHGQLPASRLRQHALWRCGRRRRVAGAESGQALGHSTRARRADDDLARLVTGSSAIQRHVFRSQQTRDAERAGAG
ncbi:MAG: SDR family NAD(P)-dependent oxidoreductase [Alphaproteobacteria bacterium]